MKRPSNLSHNYYAVNSIDGLAPSTTELDASRIAFEAALNAKKGRATVIGLFIGAALFVAFIIYNIVEYGMPAQ